MTRGMRGKRVDLEKIKAIPIELIATALGFQISGGVARCRLPGHDDKNPSFSIRSTKNRFRCFACDRSGDGISLVEIMEGTDFQGACRWINERFGAGAIQSKYHTRREKHMHLPNREILLPATATNKVMPAADSDIFNWLLERSPLQSSGASYLESRGFSLETLKDFGVGQIGNDRTLLHSAREQFGDERLRRCGIMGEGTWGPYLVFRSNYILFPFVYHHEIIFIQARKPNGESKFRWLCPIGLPPPAFNLNVLASDTSTITICEGVTDVLSAHELGIPAIGFVGASALVDVALLMRLRGRNVAVVGDADNAGKGFSQRLVQLLGDHGITAMIRKLPKEYNDMNEFLRGRKGL